MRDVYIHRCVVEIWQYMERFTGPKFLMGDLNAEPHSTPIRYLGRLLLITSVQNDDLSKKKRAQFWPKTMVFGQILKKLTSVGNDTIGKGISRGAE